MGHRVASTDPQIVDLFAHSIIRVGFAMSVVCPIYTQHQTFSAPVGTSQLGQKQISGGGTLLGFADEVIKSPFPIVAGGLR